MRTSFSSLPSLPAEARCVTKGGFFRHNISYMTEKQLIGKLKELRQIQPSKDWVSLTKNQILGQESTGFTLFPYLRPALVGFIAVLVLMTGLYVSVKSSVPGEALYAIRKIAHQGEAFFVSEQEKPAFQLKLANDRLEDLAKAPAKNLAPTISEFQANMAEAVKTLSKINASSSSPVTIQKIVAETKKLEENKQKIESLGVVIGEEEISELDSALFRIIRNLMRDLDNRTLSEEKAKILDEMRNLFIDGKYSEALEFYLINQ